MPVPDASKVPLDLDQVGHLFVNNVGGAGMSAVATLLAERGHPVSGHDPAAATPYVDSLLNLGVRVTLGPDHPGLPEDVDAVVVSTATPDDVPEVVEAHRRGVPVVHRKAALAALCVGRQTVGVAGTHGKTTTAAMLATVLEHAGAEAGWVIGAPVPGLGRNAAWGGDGPLVVEADESDGSFLALPVDLAIVTNVEADHIEHYGTFDTLVDAFTSYLAGASGARVVCADDDLARQLGAAAGAISVGTHSEAQVQICDVETSRDGTAFTLRQDGATLAKTVLPLPGLHNVRNAAVALAAAERLGVPWGDGAEALAAFGGVRRRFERRGEAFGATLVDDYAHLPSEVAAALAAAQAGPWDRVVCVFQPHRYSRTATLWQDFADAFGDADLLAITDIYSAGEPPRSGVTGKLVLDAVLDAHPWRDAAWLPGLDDVERWLRATLLPGDICLTLGAGDVTTVPDRLRGRGQ